MESKEGDFRQCIYIKKPGGLPWSAVLPVSLLPVFNFFYKNNKSEPMTNRHKVRIILFWWTRRGSNPGPPACEAGTLTSWATPPSGWSCNGKTYEYPSDTAGFGGDDETRTHDFHTASVTLYQLSYAPIIAIAEFIIPYFLSGCNPFLHFFKIVMRKKTPSGRF